MIHQEMWCILECIEMAIIRHWNKIPHFQYTSGWNVVFPETLRKKNGEKKGQPRAPKVREDHEFPSCEL